ncbi:MAG TPA: DNA-formamidopyrimidine glycosylase family protein [Gemmatimonadales bacterium]|nr:DNA-formamidopyrimidine glycosylase family protein [Gemmatimonadales bacterium]
MPELPDITVYVEALGRRVTGQPLQHARLRSPFLLRSVSPPIADAEGRTVRAVTRLGKRVVLELEGELFLVLHLMIAGRLHWKAAGAKPAGKTGLAAFDFPAGTLTLTEAGTKRRASLHLVRGREELRQFDRGGLEPLATSVADLLARLRSENHTLKRALTDPRMLSGVGNAYSDEILHRARLSPLRLTSKLTDVEGARLHAALRVVLVEWTDRLRREVGDGFPEHVTAFRAGMAVHGRFREPCPVCGTPVQRIRYAENETNYCPACQTDGRLLADRAMSRLLREDWPRSLEEMDERLGK